MTCAEAARGGHLEVLQWVRAQGCPWDEGTCCEASKGGHLEVLQWAREQGCPWDEDTCWGAFEGGHLEVLQWAQEQGCPWDWGRLVSACAWQKAVPTVLEVLQWARVHGCPENILKAVLEIRAEHDPVGVVLLEENLFL